MASLTDILTTAKNIAQGINTLVQTYINVQGAVNSGSLTATTLVKNSAGRVYNVVVTTAGSAAGTIYDANLAAATTNPIFVIPATVGVYTLNMPCSYGIVVAPGTGQNVVVSYS